MAVGPDAALNADDQGTDQAPLADHWDGSEWSLTKAPGPASTNSGGVGSETTLNSVSCPSASSCMAVGTYDRPGPSETEVTFAERWDGSTWRVVPTPNPAGTAGLPISLVSVSCSSSSSCVAVGGYSKGKFGYPLAETWDGSTWSLVQAPEPPGTSTGGLSGVSCSSPTNCKAAGTFWGKGDVSRPLVEHWDGSSLALLATPGP